MALSMPKLTRCPKTGAWVARKVIPKEIKDQYEQTYGVRAEALFRADGNLSQGAAKRLYSDWIGEVESRIEGFRAPKQELGRTLSHKEAVGLAGEWYRWFLAKYEDNPGEADGWETIFDDYISDYRQFAPPNHEPLLDPHDRWAGSKRVRPKIRPIIYTTANVERFLADKAIHLQPDALALFLDILEPIMMRAFRQIIQWASGDYSPDTSAARFPSFEAKRQAGMTVWKLWEGWIAERKPAASSVNRWRAVFLNLRDTFQETDANTISEDQANRWAKGLVTEKRTANTVSEVWLNAARTIFAWAKDQKHVDQNPFQGIKITVPKIARNRETKAFTTDEIRLILGATVAEPPARLSSHYIAARRWVPWLCAYSGARAGEITQLRGADIIERDGIWAMRLTPDAGTIKTSETRVVPLHEHVIEQGFLDFVKAKGNGPLFYDPNGRRKAVDEDVTNPRQSLAVKTRSHVADWVRAIGVSDPELSPTHAWRHTFKQVADRHGISERVSDAITGHAPTTVGRSYGAPDLADMAKALESFPRYTMPELG